MRVLVTGGTGYLGSAIVRALHARGHVPVVFARRASKAALPGVAIDGDVRNTTALHGAADAVDAVIHAAALVSIWRRRPRDFDDVNVNGLLNVIDVVRARAIPRLVYTSSFMALPPAGAQRPLDGNDYQRSKRIALDRAREARAAGTPITIVYPGVIYGPGPSTEANLVGRLLSDHLRRRLPGMIGADRVWPFAFLDDVAALHVLAVERPDARGDYMAGGENQTQRRMFELAREITGRPLPREIPIALARTAGTTMEALAALSGRPPLLTHGAVEIFSHDWPMDSRRSMAELGYRVTPFEEGVRRTLDALPYGRN